MSIEPFFFCYFFDPMPYNSAPACARMNQQFEESLFGLLCPPLLAPMLRQTPQSRMKTGGEGSSH
jgi:hypothetical protein